MNPVLIAGPAVEPVSLADMRTYLRLDDEGEDDLVAALIKAARLAVEAASGRQLIEQTWRLLLDRWPESRIVLLPVSPLVRIDKVRLFDASGTGSDLAAALYRADCTSDPPRMIVDAATPDPGLAGEGIAVDVVAGFGASAADVPAPLVQATRMLVARWFENRGDAASETVLASDVMALVAPYRGMRV